MTDEKDDLLAERPLAPPSERENVETLRETLEREASSQTSTTESEAVAQANAKAEATASPHKPTISSDWTAVLLPIPNASLHDGFGALDLPRPAYSLIGDAIGKNKLTGKAVKKITHKRRAIVMQGHDVGPPTVHAVFAPPPPLGVALSLLRTAKASRKCMFGAQNITLEKAGVLGSCTLTNWPPTPLLFCADPVPLPLACAPQSHFSTISFGMSWKDYALGYTLIAVDMLVSLAFSKMNLVDTEGLDAASGAAVGAVEGLIMGSPQATVTSLWEMAAYSLLAEPGHEHEIVWLELPGVASASTSLEKTDDTRWMQYQSEERREEREKDVSYKDDPNARYGHHPLGWGEVL